MACADEPRDRHHQPELQAAAPVEPREVELEEVLPEGVVARLDRDQLLEDRALIGGGHPVERPVEGEIEQLVEDEAAAQSGVGRGVGHRPLCYTLRERRRPCRRRRPCDSPGST
jgi:hypothetical protein